MLVAVGLLTWLAMWVAMWVKGRVDKVLISVDGYVMVVHMGKALVLSVLDAPPPLVGVKLATRKSNFTC